MTSHHGGIFSVWLDGDEPERIRNWVYNTITFANWLQRPIHLGVPSFLSERFDEIRKSTKGLPPHPTLEIVPLRDRLAETEVTDQIKRTSSTMLVLPSPSEQEHKISIGNWRLLPKHSPVPTVFFPTLRRLGQPPFSNFIVPVSGELKENLALELGLSLAEEKGLPVDLIHISPKDTSTEAPSRCDASPLGSIGDEVQHEYAERIEQLIAKGSPFSSLQKKRHIREFRHGFGDVARELKKMIQENPRSLLLVDWSGTLENGRAETIKEVLMSTGVCSILVKSPVQPRAHLKIGRERFEDSQFPKPHPRT